MRFVPDTWLDAALRPLLMGDPVNGLYVEIGAPDWRFASLVLLLGLAWLGHRRWRVLERHQTLALVGLTVGFYVWTLVSGNGRYFIWGLLMVGPMVVMVARELRATRAMRNTVILVVLTVQGVSVWMNYMPDMWSLRPWRQGPGFALEASPLRDRPAVFLTMGSISYSALVPQMHPESRWSNIAGQINISPGVREYPALLSMLDGLLPKYAVARATVLVLGPDDQPIPKAKHSIEGVLARHDLALDAPTCAYVRSADAARAFRLNPETAIEDGFWFCPVRRTGTVHPPDVITPVAPEFDDVFTRVEQRCPRVFPAGRARTRQIDGAVQRAYGYSDTTLYVDDSGEVYFKNVRALNPTTIGKIEQVRSGQFELDCDRIPGRYVPPWDRK
jgi:hypothetical protein